jgi:hypothetical protein
MYLKVRDNSRQAYPANVKHINIRHAYKYVIRMHSHSRIKIDGKRETESESVEMANQVAMSRFG